MATAQAPEPTHEPPPTARVAARGGNGCGAEDEAPFVLDLDDAECVLADWAGGKAAALARARLAGIPTLAGAVLTTSFSRAVDSGRASVEHRVLDDLFERLHAAHGTLVARSSSVVEDQTGSSAAGQFESVLGIDDRSTFGDAVATVLASREQAGAAGAPIAVLFQPELDPAVGGVLFGVDPVTGRSDRVVVTAVGSGLDSLVSGEVEGARYVLDRSAEVMERDDDTDVDLSDEQLRELVDVADRLGEVFSGPQDVEWAYDRSGQLLVLQSRPVTTEVRGVPQGPVFGPGPVAETFPEPLLALEVDLWVPPLRHAIVAALELAGAKGRSAIESSPVVVAIDGHVALDLELTGEDDQDPSLWQRANPVAIVRRLRSAWRVGRIRSALPRLADDLLDRTDADLEALPPLSELTDRQLVALIGRGRQALCSLHGHEVLTGLLTDIGDTRMTGAAVAMRVLSEARSDESDDAAIVAKSPIVLALTAPKVGSSVELPTSSQTPDLPAPVTTGDRGADETPDMGVKREALRVRIRWVQEVMARAAWELACRMQRGGQLDRAELVRHVSLDDLIAVVTKRAEFVGDLLDDVVPDTFGRPLPARFRVSDKGRPVPLRGDRTGGGTGAGGGVGEGPVTLDQDDPPAGSVLVISTLRPGLGPLLGKLAGIVAETGSVLSHLAILAREQGVATVVGYAGATEELEEGMVVRVDGETGEVEPVEEEA